MAGPNSSVSINAPVNPYKKVATYEFLDGSGNLVESEAITLTDGDGAELLGQRPSIDSVPVVLASDAALPLPAGASTEATLLNVERGVSDYETRLDYDVRTDSNPVYVGTAAQGASTASAVWVIRKLTYDATSRVTRNEVLQNVIWDNRASLGW